MPLFILAIIIFIIADVLIRMIGKRLTEKKLKKEREIVLQEREVNQYDPDERGILNNDQLVYL